MKKTIINILLIFAFALITILIVAKVEDPAVLNSMWAGIKYGYLSAAVALMVVYWLLDGFLMMKMAGVIPRQISFRHSFIISMSVQFFNAITPFASGGQPVAVYLLKKKGMTYGESTAIVVLKSLIWQTSLLSVTVISLFLNYKFLIDNISGFIPFFIIGTVTNIAVILFYCMFFSNAIMTKMMNGICNFFSKIGFKKRIDKFRENVNKEIARLGSTMKEVAHHKKNLLQFTLITIVQMTTFCSILYFIQLACEPVAANFFDMLTSQYMVTMITSMIPSPGAAGGAEGVGYVFFKMFFTTSSILAVVLIWRVITYYLNLLMGGIFCLLNKDKPLKQENLQDQP